MITLITTGMPLRRPVRCMHCQGDTSCFIKAGPVARLVRDIRPVQYQGGSVALCKYCRNYPGHGHKATSSAGLSSELVIQCSCSKQGSALKYEFREDGHRVTLLAGALFEQEQETIFYCASCEKQFDSCPPAIEVRS